MYNFNIVQRKEGDWWFELNGINLIIDGFNLNSEIYWLENPDRAIAYFTVNGNIYGLSNYISKHRTVEAFYEAMLKQYSYFKSSKKTYASLPANARIEYGKPKF